MDRRALLRGLAACGPPLVGLVALAVYVPGLAVAGILIGTWYSVARLSGTRQVRFVWGLWVAAVVAGLIAASVGIVPRVLWSSLAVIPAVAVLCAVQEYIDTKCLKTSSMTLLGFGVLMPAVFFAYVTAFRAIAFLLDEHVTWLSVAAVMPDVGRELPLADRADRAIAGIAAVSIALVYVRELRWLFLQRQQIRNLATSKARSVALGIAELSGTARKVAADEESSIIMTSYTPQPFYLEDDTGRILVDPCSSRGLVQNVHMSDIMHLSVSAVALDKDELRDGEPVYVVGTAERREDASVKDVDQDALVVRRRTPLAGMKLVAGSAAQLVAPLIMSGKKAGTYLDVFFVTDRGQEGAMRVMREMQKQLVVTGLLLLALMGWLGMSRHYRLAPPGLEISDPVIAQASMPDPLRKAFLYAVHKHPQYRAFAEHELSEPAELSLRPDMITEEQAFDFLNSPIAIARDFAAWRLEDVEVRPGHTAHFDALVTDFESCNGRARLLLMKWLPQLDIGPKRGAELLRRAFLLHNWRIRGDALRSVTRFLDAGVDFAPAVVECLMWDWDRSAIEYRGEGKRFRNQARAVLGMMGRKAIEALDAAAGKGDEVAQERVFTTTLTLIDDPADMIRRASAHLTDGRGHVLRGMLTGAIRNPTAWDSQTRRKLRGLICPLIEHEDYNVRQSALYMLTKLKTEFLNSKDEAAVLKLLAEGNPYEAAFVLVETAKTDPGKIADALMMLARKNRKGSAYAFGFAVRRMGKFGEVSRKTIPLFVELLNDDNKKQWLDLMLGLHELDKGMPEAVAALVKRSDFQATWTDYRTVYPALKVLAKWGEVAALEKIADQSGQPDVAAAARKELNALRAATGAPGP